jgi:hypothetical protein
MIRFLNLLFALGLTALLSVQLVVNIETNRIIRLAELTPPPEPPPKSVSLDPSVLKGMHESTSIGIQQRSILLQRLLGLEHIHRMHDGKPVQMCPACNSQTQTPPERVATKE